MPGPPIDVGSVLAGRLRIERKIGSGAMGVVFEATDLKLGRRVAVKVLGEDGAPDPAYAQRMEREAKAAASLTSEHVTRVYDFGTLDDGTPFLVMELLAGRSLADRLESDGPMPVATAIRHLLAAIDAVGEAHGLGLIHRDLKPENLFLAERPGRPPVVKVLDFGIVKDLSADAPRITMTGVSVGTPAYMAPEQISGGAVDARTDVWALGVTLYELISGGPLPFDTSTIPGILSRIVREAPTPLTEHVKDVPPAILAILDRCMAKPPSERFPTVLALGEALRACLPPETAQVGVDAFAPTLDAKPKRAPVRRTRWGLLVFTAFMTVVVALAGAYASWRTSPARRRHAEPNVPVVVADASLVDAAETDAEADAAATDAGDPPDAAEEDLPSDAAVIDARRGVPQGPVATRLTALTQFCPLAGDAGVQMKTTVEDALRRIERERGKDVQKCFAATEFTPPDHFGTVYDVTLANGKVQSVSTPYPHPQLMPCLRRILVGEPIVEAPEKCVPRFQIVFESRCACIEHEAGRCVRVRCK